LEKSIVTQDYASFRQALKRARKKAGLTQTELAERLGETQSFVSKCERGERRLDIVEVRSYCRALGVEFTSFALGLDQQLNEQARSVSGTRGHMRDE
jgi:transcriptional regulator with XRE-family HTH domain